MMIKTLLINLLSRANTLGYIEALAEKTLALDKSDKHAQIEFKRARKDYKEVEDHFEEILTNMYDGAQLEEYNRQNQPI